MQERSPAQPSRMTGSLPPPSCGRESGGSKGGRQLMDQPGREVRAEVPGGCPPPGRAWRPGIRNHLHTGDETKSAQEVLKVLPTHKRAEMFKDSLICVLTHLFCGAGKHTRSLAHEQTSRLQILPFLPFVLIIFYVP